MQVLTAQLETLLQEPVLMQAWKKASSYIRQYNWFSDTLELDETTVNLQSFIASLVSDLREGNWETDPLRLVAAPKSQSWGFASGKWAPPRNASAKIRPLAHVSIRDQVVSTAILLLLADRVETAQGDPRLDFESANHALSFGNRLFCDRADKGQVLRHRWGATKLYRGFFQDYRNFLAKPEWVADNIEAGTSRITVVQSDLSQFYDRVTPELLHSKIRLLQQPEDDPAFFDLACQIMSWKWHRHDQKAAADYATANRIGQLERVALPQGLVASGFFANVVLLDFDRRLAAARGQNLQDGIQLHDAARYVDDLRLVLTVDRYLSGPDIETAVVNWLNQVLDETAGGLLSSREKTKAAFIRGETQPLLRQSRRMVRIQTAVSGGFDATGGENIIEAVQGLVRAQDQFAGGEEPSESRSTFLPVPDVRSETVNRFAAVRFRRTFRSLRPLLEDGKPAEPNDAADEESIAAYRPPLTKADLDDEARAFAFSLIDKWAADPSNVRLLRVGLDIWPAADLLRRVLDLLEPYTSGKGRLNARKIAHYCLAEIFRAGATETGIVPDHECLPEGVDLARYREVLVTEASRILRLPNASTPWYLKQQALLCLAVLDPLAAPISQPGRTPETKRYRDLICFLRGDWKSGTASEFATLAVVTRRALRTKDDALSIVSRHVDDQRFKQILSRDPAFAAEIRGDAIHLGTSRDASDESWTSLYNLVRAGSRLNALRNELGLVSFARAFVEASIDRDLPERISPDQVLVQTAKEGMYGRVTGLAVQSEILEFPGRALYDVPGWVTPESRWRFQLGFLLRFILTAQLDYTRSPGSWDAPRGSRKYRPVSSQWYQRIYALYNGHDAFGDDWLPISQRFQDFLFSLLSWPGCREGKAEWVKGHVAGVLEILQAWEWEAAAEVGDGTGCLFLKVPAPICIPGDTARPLRACVVQTVTPNPKDYKDAFARGDYYLDDQQIRRRHRNHLSTALAAVEKMLALRETHKSHSNRLDWLILPELAVHRDDVFTHLVPFARAFKTIILAGMVFDQIVPGDPLANTALWIIPRHTEQFGLQVLFLRQGKQFLAPIEQQLNAGGTIIHGFRPCQWLIGYEWSKAPGAEPLWLTASVCYDATDLNLAADLRLRSDVFAIPALNRDVGTFDQMAQALHYHMYQLVVVANNGSYGGSNAHWPKKEPFVKQMFHTHGQPQASISFFELEDIADMKARHTAGKAPPPPSSPTSEDAVVSLWKFPPAGT